jgi:hypothetical protein
VKMTDLEKEAIETGCILDRAILYTPSVVCIVSANGFLDITSAEDKVISLEPPVARVLALWILRYIPKEIGI